MEDMILDLGMGKQNEYDIYEDFRKNRRIIINDQISEALIEDVTLMIAKWNEEDKDIIPQKRKKIVIFINSPGGDVVSGLNLLDAIDASETPVITVGLSECASMASYLLAAGHKRYCYSNTVVLIHDGEQGYQTSAGKGKDIQAFFDKLTIKCRRYLVDHSEMTEEYLESVADREVYIFGDEAKEKGIVDGIIGKDIRMSEIM